MKKFSILMVLLSVMVFIAGCTNSKDVGNSSVTKTTDMITEFVTTNAPTTVAVTTAVPTTDEPTTKEPTTKQEEATTSFDYGSELFGKLTQPFTFASGVGAWSTSLNIHEDGSFDGNYHDSDMGDRGDDYPHGTLYYCDFSGRFGEVEKINDYTYSMKMLDIEYAQEPDTEEIKDGQKYKYTTAYGLDEANKVIVYFPDTPVDDLPEGFVNWTSRLQPYDGNIIGYYGLYNVNEAEGFVSQKR